MIRKLLTALTVAAVFLTASCTDGTLKTSARTSRPDPSWVTAISLHSNGAISRHSPIRVLFTSDVIAAERVGADASANIRIQPEVKARAVFASRREIVLRPETEFAPGTAVPHPGARPRDSTGVCRRRQAVRVRGDDTGRELRCAHLRPGRRARAQRTDDAARRRS